MWIPDRFALPLDEAYAALADLGAADLLTPHEGGIAATFLPLVLDETAGSHGTLRGHLARLNPHVDALRAAEASAGESLVIAHVDDAYISPTWYPSKATNPKTVPTWNYTVIHLHGPVRVVEDHDWILRHLRDLSDHFEEHLPDRWTIDDAPADYIDGMAKAVVGVEMAVTRIEAKAKQSQNKSPEDVAGVVEGLRSHGAHGSADAVAHANRDKEWPPPRLKYR
ncbi:FMN-binding negative transcriptional regulator [Mariniluteicoccus endophyticus]